MSCSPFGSVKFLFMAPMILTFLFVINVITSPGHWWIQWPALGLGIAWFINLFKVMRTLVVLGGLAGLAALMGRRSGRW
jgi:hypothetical protein